MWLERFRPGMSDANVAFIWSAMWLIQINQVMTMPLSDPNDGSFDAMAEVVIDVPMMKSQAENVAMMTEAAEYMTRYGYAQNATSASSMMMNMNMMRDGLSRLQELWSLPITGKLDNATMSVMKTPRCGMPDVMDTPVTNRRKRYAVQGSIWKQRQLTYRVDEYTKQLDKKTVDDVVDKGFKYWSDVANLTFVRAPPEAAEADIEIRFVRKEHGDGDAFDGPLGRVGHAFYPTFGGNAHFDDDETWTVKVRRGTNLLQVAVHEFGHSLGLLHSMIPEAAMYPSYRGYNADYKLHEDDVEAIQELYGEREKPGSVRPKSAPSDAVTPKQDDSPSDIKSLCKDSGSYDTMLTDAKGTYVFKDDKYWELDPLHGIKTGYPKKASTKWPKLPSNPDAAFHLKRAENTAFFKGDQIWRYDRHDKLMSGYPLPITRQFPDLTGKITKKVDAAFVWSRTGHIYLFNGDEFWVWIFRLRPHVPPTYPKKISLWRGVPGKDLDAVMTWRNRATYFFKGNKYWKFNDNLGRTEAEADGYAYPRNVGLWWFGCAENNSSNFLNKGKTQEKHTDSGYQEKNTHSALRTFPECNGVPGKKSAGLLTIVSAFAGFLGARAIFLPH